MENFTIAAVFSDNMVIQRNKFVCFFGEADENLIIKVALFDREGAVLSENECAAQNGKWKTKLEPQKAQTNCKIAISAKKGETQIAEKTFENVCVGEVWLAGGQSNMEFELQNCAEGPEELENQKEDPNVRFYYTNKIAWKDEYFYEAEKKSCWQTWQSEGKKSWSAAGYFFAKKLAKDLGCAVGIIGCNWGGTSASAWMKEDFLKKDDDLREYLNEQAEATAGKSIEKQIEEYGNYEKEYKKWEEGYSKLWRENRDITWEQAEKTLGKNPWPGPKSCKNPYRPAGLYDCMLSRIAPFTLQGVIWYQGESDDHKPKTYAKLFGTMIENWREDFENPELPFVFAQLPAHRYEQDKDFKHWCLIREAQEKIHRVVKNSWMTCALDLGQFNDIHPKSKKTIAERMEKNALANVYGKIPPSEALSPILKDFMIKDDSILLVFDNAEKGFEIRKDEKVTENYKKLEKIQGNEVPKNFTGFEIAGEDGIFYPAEFEFGEKNDALNAIILRGEKTPRPVAARYAWYNYGPAEIFGKNGLPLAPFRTNQKDDAKIAEHAEIQQIMTCS